MLWPSPSLPTTHVALMKTSRSCSLVGATPRNSHKAHPSPASCTCQCVQPSVPLGPASQSSLKFHYQVYSQSWVLHIPGGSAVYPDRISHPLPQSQHLLAYCYGINLTSLHLLWLVMSDHVTVSGATIVTLGFWKTQVNFSSITFISRRPLVTLGFFD